MKKSEEISRTLENIFHILTKDATEFYTDLYRYKICEVKINGKKMGIGISPDSSAIKLFITVNGWKENSPQRFGETFYIGQSEIDPKMLSIELSPNSMTTNPENASLLADNVDALSEIIKRIAGEKNSGCMTTFKKRAE